MTLSDLSIRNPVFAWMLMFAMILFGAISFSRMGISQMPDVEFPVVNITLTDIGASPETMEMDVVDPIEGAVMQVDGVQDVTSQSLEGLATITITFDLARNIDGAMADVQDAVTSVQKQLPTDMDPPQYAKTDPDDQPIVWFALHSTSPKTTMRDLMIYVDDVLQDQFASVDGVGEVRMGGYLAPELRVWMDSKKMRNFQMTSADVISAIGNEHVDLPSGLIETTGRDANVRTLSQAMSPEQFGNMYMEYRGGAANYRRIRLNQVATVEEGLGDVLRISRADGQLAVGLGIVKQRGTNAVAVGNAVKAKMLEVNKYMPEGMQLSLNFDTTQFIENAVHDLEKNLILAALATALVCWIFLGSWSATFNVILAIPTSVIGTFTILYFSGFTLNTFTLLGLSLAIGIVVDDAIMVLENIVRHQEMGKNNLVAAMDGARQITFAAVATSLAIVAIFLPVAFMRGVIGKYFYQFGITMVAAVLLSLLEAITLTPMRCAEFVHVGERTTRFGKMIDGIFNLSAKYYEKLLGIALNHRVIVLVTSVILFVASMGISSFLRKEFVPSQDESAFLLSFLTPVGSSMDFTMGRIQEAEKFLMKEPAILRVYDAVGGSYGGQLNTAFGFISMKPKGYRPIDPVLGHQITQQEEMDRCRKELAKIPNLQVFVQDLSTRGFTATKGFPIELGVRGPDWDTLVSSGLALEAAMQKSPYLTDVSTDFQTGMPEVDVVPDRIKASLRGVSVATIAQELNAMFGGEEVGYYPRGGHEDQIEVRLKPDQRNSESQIKDLYVRNNRGEVIPLIDVVTLTDKLALQQITRDERQRTITLYANFATGKSQSETLAEVQKLANQILPKGYYIVFNAGSTIFSDSMHDMIFALILGIAVAYMVLASQFNSFIDPFTVLMALPFSASGALLALWMFNLSLNIYSMIGLILLMGIVKKNSIMLVDFANEVRAEAKGKLSIRDALLKACPFRYRPIVMTSVAIIAASIPEALGRGPGSETQVPLAVVLIGGVSVATILTLFVVPCFYSVVAPWGKRDERQAKLEAALVEVEEEKKTAAKKEHSFQVKRVQKDKSKPKLKLRKSVVARAR